MRRWENCPRCRVTVERVTNADGSPAHVDVLGDRHRCRLSDVLDVMMMLPEFLRLYEEVTLSRFGLTARLLRAARDGTAAHYYIHVPRMAGKTHALRLAQQVEAERRKAQDDHSKGNNREA